MAALLAAMLLICAGIAMVAYNERAYAEAKLQQVQAQAAILASTVAAALAFDDAKATQEYVDALRADVEMVGGRCVRRAGTS
jgi:hypothetical protein